MPVAEVLPPSTTVTSPEISFVRGIDISRSAGEPTQRDFENIRHQGYRFVIVSGWGGVNPNRHASVQLSRARDAGLLTAGYCYVNFSSPLDGGCQVREALTAFGTEWAYLGFLAIDVETSAANQLSPGLRSEPPLATAQQLAVTRIAEAVQEVHRMGLSAVIYTKQDDWQRITGDTQQFKSLPLWHPKTIGGDDINEPDLANPGYTFGGWTTRTGKQYVLDTFLDNPRIQVDLNVFDLNAFSRSSPGYREPANIRIAAAD
jgi:glycosyl hydrolase family 25